MAWRVRGKVGGVRGYGEGGDGWLGWMAAHTGWEDEKTTLTVLRFGME